MICEECESGLHYDCGLTIDDCPCERCVDTIENGCTCTNEGHG